MGFKKDDPGAIPKSSFTTHLVFLPRVYFMGYSSHMLSFFVGVKCEKRAVNKGYFRFESEFESEFCHKYAIFDIL